MMWSVTENGGKDTVFFLTDFNIYKKLMYKQIENNNAVQGG